MPNRQFIPIAAFHAYHRWTVEDAGPYDVLSIKPAGVDVLMALETAGASRPPYDVLS